MMPPDIEVRLAEAAYRAATSKAGKKAAKKAKKKLSQVLRKYRFW